VDPATSELRAHCDGRLDLRSEQGADTAAGTLYIGKTLYASYFPSYLAA